MIIKLYPVIILCSLFVEASAVHAEKNPSGYQDQSVSDVPSTSLSRIPLDFTFYSSWSTIPVYDIVDSGELETLFRPTLLSKKLPSIKFYTWEAKTSLAQKANGEYFLSRTSDTWRSYNGAQWSARSFVSFLTNDGFLFDYLRVDDKSGAIVPFGVLDVWAKKGHEWGLISTGVMKNQDATVPNPFEGRNNPWPEESRFPGVRPMLPDLVIFPRDVGVNQDLSLDYVGRYSDNWEALVPKTALDQRNYKPAACNLISQDKVYRVGEPKRIMTISGLFKLDLHGDVGQRWVFVYTNAGRLRFTSGIAEYFGIDAGPAGNGRPPNSKDAEFGRIFYGQEVLVKPVGGDTTVPTVRVNWSAAVWNRIVRRTGGGHVANCPGLNGSINEQFRPQ